MYIFKVTVFTKQAKYELLFLVPRIQHVGARVAFSSVFDLAVLRATVAAAGGYVHIQGYCIHKTG